MNDIKAVNINKLHISFYESFFFLLITTFDISVLEDISTSNGVQQHGQDVILNEDRIHRKVLLVKLKE